MKRLLPVLLFLSCHATEGASFEPLPEKSDGDEMLELSTMDKEDFVFTFLLTAPDDPELSAEEMKTAMAGHFSNMRKLGEERVLLFAGPLGEPRSQPDHRGIFVLNTPNVADGEVMAATDPAIQAGVFAIECHPFRSATDLRRIPELIEEQRDEQEDAEKPPANIRAYVMVTTKALDESALDRIGLLDVVVMTGMFGGTMEGTACMIVAAETVDEARELLGSRSVATDALTFHPLWGTDVLVQL